MRDRTYVVAGLAIMFLALQVVAGITTRHSPIDPTPTLYIAVACAALCLWVAMLLGAKWAWWPLAARYAYSTTVCALGIAESGLGFGGVEIADIIMMIALTLTQAVPLIALILDPPWGWKKEEAGKTTAT